LNENKHFCELLTTVAQWHCGFMASNELSTDYIIYIS